MEIKIAEICGLCNGCKRAIDTVFKEVKNGREVVIFKEIVHNKNVNKMLIDNGALTLDNLNDLKPNHLVIIRGHGETPQVFDYLDNNKIEYRDCTCPNVLKIHEKIIEYSAQGYEIILLGKHKEKMHPEVEGNIAWSTTNCYLVEDQNDIQKIPNAKNKKYYIACQTTFNMQKAEEYINFLQEHLKDSEIIINKSLCTAQKEINNSSANLAKTVDVMIVVGGKNSSNSKELYKHMSSICPSIFIEDINTYRQELQNANITITKDSKIGITAGASTMKEELQNLKTLIEKDYNF